MNLLKMFELIHQYQHSKFVFRDLLIHQQVCCCLMIAVSLQVYPNELFDQYQHSRFELFQLKIRAAISWPEGCLLIIAST